MLTLHALALCAALSAPGDATLLHFSAPWCGPCQEMEPVTKRLESAGFSVRHINVDREKGLAEQFRVTGVPCFVLVANGRIVDRVEGKTSYDRLAQMFGEPSPATILRGQDALATKSNSSLFSGGLPSLLPRGSNAPAQTAPVQTAATITPATAKPLGNQRDPFAPKSPLGQPNVGDDTTRRLAMQATVRLRVEDQKTFSVGTGTVVDTHGDEALVLTCGHIFRDAKGQSIIHVDQFGPQGERTAQGRLVDFDLARDIGLVSFKPAIRVTPVPVADPSQRSAVGELVFSVGCDKGSPPQLQESHVTHINRFLGPANIEVAGQPSDGRSGGGLFANDGRIIGVCNAADPADKIGIYAALDNIHWQLKRIGLQRLYERAPAFPTPNAAPDPLLFANGARPGNSRVETTDVGLPAMHAPRSQPAGMNPIPVPSPNPTFAPGPMASPMPRANDDNEIIFIVRSRSNPQGKSEVYLLDRASPELMEKLTRESRPLLTPNAPRGLSNTETSLVPVMRGQR